MCQSSKFCKNERKNGNRQRLILFGVGENCSKLENYFCFGVVLSTENKLGIRPWSTTGTFQYVSSANHALSTPNSSFQQRTALIRLSSKHHKVVISNRFWFRNASKIKNILTHNCNSNWMARNLFFLQAPFYFGINTVALQPYRFFRISTFPPRTADTIFYS